MGTIKAGVMTGRTSTTGTTKQGASTGRTRSSTGATATRTQSGRKQYLFVVPSITEILTAARRRRQFLDDLNVSEVFFLIVLKGLCSL
jgi:hypothetical protein